MALGTVLSVPLTPVLLVLVSWVFGPSPSGFSEDFDFMEFRDELQEASRCSNSSGLLLVGGCYHSRFVGSRILRADVSGSLGLRDPDSGRPLEQVRAYVLRLLEDADLEEVRIVELPLEGGEDEAETTLGAFRASYVDGRAQGWIEARVFALADPVLPDFRTQLSLRCFEEDTWLAAIGL